MLSGDFPGYDQCHYYPWNGPRGEGDLLAQ